MGLHGGESSVRDRSKRNSLLTIDSTRRPLLLRRALGRRAPTGVLKDLKGRIDLTLGQGVVTFGKASSLGYGRGGKQSDSAGAAEPFKNHLVSKVVTKSRVIV